MVTLEFKQERLIDLMVTKIDKAKQGKGKQSNFCLLTHAGYVAATQLMWACGITACALRLTSEYSFTDIGRMDS